MMDCRAEFGQITWSEHKWPAQS